MYAIVAMAIAISLGLRAGIRDAWWRMPMAIAVPALLVARIWPPLPSARPLVTVWLYALAAVLLIELVTVFSERALRHALSRQAAPPHLQKPRTAVELAVAFWRSYQRLSAGVLVIALCATAGSLVFLPRWSMADKSASDLPPALCWIDGHLVPTVGCLGTGADWLIGAVLTFAMAWTLNAPLIVDAAFVGLGRFGLRGDLPIAVFWLVSLFAAVGALSRSLRRRRPVA